MKKQNHYNIHYRRSGQFYTKHEYLKNQTRARLALAFFLLAALASAAYEATATILINN